MGNYYNVLFFTGTEAHNAENMGKIIKKVMEEIGPMKILGICTDNAPNMKAAWQCLHKEYKHLQTYGCLAHTLHLMFSDINKIKSAENLRSQCSKIVTSIKLSQRLSAFLKQHQTNQHSLKLPVQSR